MYLDVAASKTKDNILSKTITNSIMEYLYNNPIPLVALLIGIISLIINLRSKRATNIKYYFRTFRVLAKPDKMPRLKISYDNVRINSFYISKFIVLNSGVSSIDKSALATIDSLRIEAKNHVNILSYRVVYQSKIANNFKLSKDDSSNFISIKFDFLDSFHGAVLEIGHDGLDEKNFELKGTLKGVKKIVEEKSIESITKGITLFTLRIIVYFSAIGIGSFFINDYWELYIAYLIIVNIALLSTWEYFNNKFTYKNELYKFYEKF